MIRGLYTSASGMIAQMAKNDVAANNLANVNTTGFKKDTAIFRSFPEMLLKRINDPDKTASRPIIGNLGTGAVLDEVITNNSQGSLQETGAPLNLAIAGEGYFVVKRDGKELYTRNGNFTLDNQGFLTTANGDRVQGQSGDIQINGKQVSVDLKGAIIVDKNSVGTLRMITVQDPKQLVKLGDSFFTGGQAQAFKGEVRQGFLEASNVNPIVEMVDLISIMRAYETSQKAIQAHDQLLDKAVNEVGRV